MMQDWEDRQPPPLIERWMVLLVSMAMLAAALSMVAGLLYG